MRARVLMASAAALALLATGEARAQEIAAGPKSFQVSINPLGFLQFGPNIEVEKTLADVVSVAAGARVLSLGLIPHLIADDLGLAWTGTLAVRFYPQEKPLEQWWAGARVEIGRTDRTNYTSTLVGGAADAGYRWMWSNGFTLGLGLQAGAMTANYQHKRDAGDTGTDLFIFAMGVVSLGFGR